MIKLTLHVLYETNENKWQHIIGRDKLNDLQTRQRQKVYFNLKPKDKCTNITHRHDNRPGLENNLISNK